VPARTATTPAQTATTPAGAATTTVTPSKPLTATTTTLPAPGTRPGARETLSTLRLHRARPSQGSTRPSGEAIALAAIGVLLLLACAAWVFARWRAYEPHWLVSLRHATAEAGFRMSATWAEFTDWARLGR
jgi:cobalamin biosynthesis Mg chelatase CobN